ncbi:hypothetical protein FPSE_08403 [Fusarium pseudograminearum CS3096]|uniref:TLC domain-containing protein n=1 Tax=Fusarium pseudograminearum (strain CS3096) TaxID=1028729 RepID=K3VYX2_FUSPC|nr:hypothetical protein FPSE_08403 [Fusarium pseudograminearum CS3096]EKJ71395.1 hypothetical protein FPSE_08403 [Fusarium pseudograminearum CS3096]
MTKPEHRHMYRPKISTLENNPISPLLPYGSLILACCVICIALITNCLERWLLPRIYKRFYPDLEKDERRRRSFTYFHVGAFILISLVISTGYPIMDFLVGDAVFSAPVVNGGKVTVGDHLLVATEVYCAYYIFEMCFRTKFASYISIAHHIGLLIIAQTALSLFADPRKNHEATVEFYMCMVWGTFDVVVEIPIFLTMIIWRIKRDNALLLSRLAFGCCVWAVVAAITETIVTIHLLQSSWNQWGLEWKIITPVVFSLWITTQLYGSTRLYAMARAESRKAKCKSESQEDLPI